MRYIQRTYVLNGEPKIGSFSKLLKTIKFKIFRTEQIVTCVYRCLRDREIRFSFLFYPLLLFPSPPF